MRSFALLSLALCGLSASAFGQITISYGAASFQISVKSDGSTPLDTGFTFELGSFGGFAPSSSNLADWAANFEVVASTTWIPVFGGFSGGTTLESPGDDHLVGDSAFVWGYNSKSFVPGSEWVLIDVGQVFPSIPANPTAGPSWDLSALAGSSAVDGIGFIGNVGGNPFLQTAAVPEPATYAALLGLATLLIVGYRRFRLGRVS